MVEFCFCSLVPALLFHVSPQRPRGIEGHVAIDQSSTEHREYANPVIVNFEARPTCGRVIACSQPFHPHYDTLTQRIAVASRWL
jgi:hypothetical protein